MMLGDVGTTIETTLAHCQFGHLMQVESKMDLFGNFSEEMAARSPQWVGIWVNVMIVVLMAAVPFSFIRKEARWILLGTVLGMAGTVIAYAIFGYTRILGIGHILFWTPTVLYMLSWRKNWDVVSTWFGKWIVLACTVMGVSLVFDYSDFARWAAGERGIIEPIAPAGGTPSEQGDSHPA